jgi:hypothetical protein
MRICLDRKKQNQWSVELQARAQFYLGNLLRVVGKSEEGQNLRRNATHARDNLLQQLGGILRVDPVDERVTFDSMVGIWHLRLTGPLHGSSDANKWW